MADAPSAPPVPDDTDLVRGLRSDDAEACAALFDRHVDRVHAYCFRRLGSYAAAEDATSATFLELWRTRGRAVAKDGSALPWLYGIAVNVCRNQHRGHRRHLHLVDRLETTSTGTADDHAETVTARVDAEVQMRRVLDRLETLSPDERNVVTLVAWQGLTYDECAAALNIPIGTVRSRLSRARRRLDAEEPR